MQFTPMTEEEIAANEKKFPVYPAGEYPFEIVTAKEGPSKSSEYPRIALNIKIFNLDGTYTWVNDYLSSSPKAAFKVRNCAEACGLLDRYNSGELIDTDFLGKQGFVKVAVEPEDTVNGYPEKNKVVTYVVKKEKVSFKPTVDKKAAAMKAMEPAKKEDILSDDIPFN